MELPLVTLKPVFHRGQECIVIDFSDDTILPYSVRKLKDVRFSRTHHASYIPLTEAHYKELRVRFKDMCRIDTNPLRAYLQQRKATVALLPNDKVSAKRAAILINQPLYPENLQAFIALQNMIALKCYSKNTMRSYCGAFHQLLRILGKVAVSSLTKDHIQSYLLYLIKRGLTESYVHTAINAIKFYFEWVEKRDKEFYQVPRPKKRVLLPDNWQEQK